MVPHSQDGKTALELARDTSTVECFLKSGVKLSGIVTEEVAIGFVVLSVGCVCVLGCV